MQSEDKRFYILTSRLCISIISLKWQKNKGCLPPLCQGKNFDIHNKFEVKNIHIIVSNIDYKQNNSKTYKASDNKTVKKYIKTL